MHRYLQDLPPVEETTTRRRPNNLSFLKHIVLFQPITNQSKIEKIRQEQQKAALRLFKLLNLKNTSPERHTQLLNRIQILRKTHYKYSYGKAIKTILDDEISSYLNKKIIREIFDSTLLDKKIAQIHIDIESLFTLDVDFIESMYKPEYFFTHIIKTIGTPPLTCQQAQFFATNQNYQPSQIQYYFRKEITAETDHIGLAPSLFTRIHFLTRENTLFLRQHDLRNLMHHIPKEGINDLIEELHNHNISSTEILASTNISQLDLKNEPRIKEVQNKAKLQLLKNALLISQQNELLRTLNDNNICSIYTLLAIPQDQLQKIIASHPGAGANSSSITNDIVNSTYTYYHDILLRNKNRDHITANPLPLNKLLPLGISTEDLTKQKLISKLKTTQPKRFNSRNQLYQFIHSQNPFIISRAEFVLSKRIRIATEKLIELKQEIDQIRHPKYLHIVNDYTKLLYEFTLEWNKEIDQIRNPENLDTASDYNNLLHQFTLAWNNTTNSPKPSHSLNFLTQWLAKGVNPHLLSENLTKKKDNLIKSSEIKRLTKKEVEYCTQFIRPSHRPSSPSTRKTSPINMHINNPYI